MDCKLYNFKKWVNCKSISSGPFTGGEEGASSDRNTKLSNLDGITYEIIYSKVKKTSLLSIQPTNVAPIYLSFKEKVLVSVVTYSYHNIVIFLTLESTPSQVHYITLDRPKGNEISDPEVLRKKYIAKNMENILKNAELVKDFKLAFGTHVLSRMIANGSDSKVAVRFYTEYKKPEPVKPKPVAAPSGTSTSTTSTGTATASSAPAVTPEPEPEPKTTLL